MPLTYSDYLKLDELLSLQEPLSSGPEHDETLFIIIHQVYELWFKEILHEIDHLQGLLGGNDPPLICHTLKRILKILKILVIQIDVLETMTPLEFLSFRDRLETASGFQSYQFRELEFALGHKREAVMMRFPPGSLARRHLEDRYRQRSLWDGFLAFLAYNGCILSDAILKRDVTRPVQASPEVQAALIQVYRRKPNLSQICELLVDLDEGLQEWRYRHAKMVERTIGTKQGTGGSPGVDYLRSTLLAPLFPDLWIIRSEL